MFKKISSSITTWPLWATQGSRWQKLDLYDRLLDGTFYDHLKYSFYDETDGQDKYIPLIQRRPSCQYRLPRYVARWAARKLFAGRHIPKIRAPDKQTEQKIKDLLTGTRIWPTMFEAAYRGSVGAVAITYRVDGKKIGLKVWRAVWCSPVFDDFGELLLLRVHYITTPDQLAAIGMTGMDPNKKYWFIRDYTIDDEKTYQPELADDWNPVNGFRVEGRSLVPVIEVHHGLGFVPGIWICNPGGMLPDGAALWEDAIPNTIECDYLLSQAARGSRYSCAPQLVTKGELLASNEDGGINPTTTLNFAAERKDPEGNVIGAGDAKLLEMNGSGAEAALKIVETLKKLALEQIGVVQKDPGEMPGPLSGRAMEYLDEDAHDTAMQWRNTYGDGGALPLICKILRTLDDTIDVTKLWLQWPRIYQPTPADLQSIVQALVMATSPTMVKGGPVGEDGSQPTMPPLLPLDVASTYLQANMDLGILDDTNGGAVPGASGAQPSPAQPDVEQGYMYSQFWRILPPIKAG